MKTARASGTPTDGSSAARVHLTQLHGGAQPIAINAVTLQLQHALAQVNDLKQALAASQQESVASRQQVEVLTKANARLRENAVQREFVRDAAQRSNWKPTDYRLCDGLEPNMTPHFERLLTKRIRFRDGEVLYRVGDEFKALYAIRAGSCKTNLLGSGGQYQVAGYHMIGEVIGMDGIGTDTHECQATALEDMEVCPLPFSEIESLARLSDQFRRNLHKLLSQEFTRAQALMLLLGTMRADKRLAVYLLDLSQRYRARGYSSSEFVLRMTREEIGSYLGIKLETVSRAFSRFQHEGMLQVQGRTVKLLDRVALTQLVD
jgi:CRP/FNR family transcriptional regulator, anaerobic regulatory protein